MKSELKVNLLCIPLVNKLFTIFPFPIEAPLVLLSAA